MWLHLIHPGCPGPPISDVSWVCCSWGMWEDAVRRMSPPPPCPCLAPLGNPGVRILLCAPHSPHLDAAVGRPCIPLHFMHSLPVSPIFPTFPVLSTLLWIPPSLGSATPPIHWSRLQLQHWRQAHYHYAALWCRPKPYPPPPPPKGRGGLACCCCLMVSDSDTLPTDTAVDGIDPACPASLVLWPPLQSLDMSPSLGVPPPPLPAAVHPPPLFSVGPLVPPWGP